MSINNSSMNMDPETAKKLFDEGAVLIIAGIPIGTEFGIDLCGYSVGDRFRGIKMIPPGVHYIYSASKGSYSDSGPRVGFLYFFKPHEIVVREWDPDNEELRQRRTQDSEMEKRRIRDNLRDLDRFLAPYDYSNWKNWLNLAGFITEEGVEKCSPECGVVRTNMELMSCPDSERPRGNSPLLPNLKLKNMINEDDLLPNLKPVPGTAPRFTDLPNRVPTGATPAEVSQHHMDCIMAIECLMKNFSNPIRLVEEIQIAFILFLIGHNVESLVHWRKILNLMSNSEVAVSKFKLFYMKYLEVLQYQLPQLPEELREPNDKNKAYKDIRNLLLNCSVGGLTVSVEKLIRGLENNMKWKFDDLFDENPEDMPVIVHT